MVDAWVRMILIVLSVPDFLGFHELFEPKFFYPSNLIFIKKSPPSFVKTIN